jgi:hypothetical protein
VPAGPPYVAVVGAAEPTEAQARAAVATGLGELRNGLIVRAADVVLARAPGAVTPDT